MAEKVCMTIAVYTSDLNEDNGHLMPWRTVLEVAAHFIRLRQNAIVLSGCQNQNAPRCLLQYLVTDHLNWLIIIHNDHGIGFQNSL